MIKIYNTLTRKKDDFKSIVPGKVKMYVCGPTVYNFIHIGNARPLVFFDTVRRYFEYKGYEVQFVQNFTDIDDKIINKANELNIPAKEVSETFIHEFQKDIKALNLKTATHNPKVTENMTEIIDFIDQLVEKGYAYQSEGDVYFKTREFSDYGKLSKQSIDDLITGARVEPGEKKDNPLDFVLWKGAKPKEEFWDSPWGKGRPGWHIECSAMVKKYLGNTIDIHGGGADLVFPHHENEIAQSESIQHEPLANYWMHNGYINIDDQKMSKSIGNVLTVRDLVNEHGGEVLRYILLSVHYRNPVNFSDELIQQGKNSIERINSFNANLVHRLKSITEDEIGAEPQSSDSMALKLNELEQNFFAEMDDDFNTANSITTIFELIKQGNLYMQNKSISKEVLKNMQIKLEEWLKILGLEGILATNDSVEDHHWIQELIDERNIARAERNWKKADEIRDLLLSKGILIEDTPQGVRWRRK